MIDIYDKLGIPDSCYLGKRIFKKLFYENSQLNSTDKKAFVNDIEDIEWTYTLKPRTINIQKFEDEEHEYLEVAIIQVNLKENFRYKRISQIIQKSIPYPVIIIFKCESSIALNLAMKRINRADQNKIKVTELHYTDWIDLKSPTYYQLDFFDSVSISKFSFDNFYEWYSDFLKRIIALNCAAYKGNYEISPVDVGIDRVEELEQIYTLEEKQKQLRSELKKETQFNKRVELNMEIKKTTQQIDEHKLRI